MAQAISGGLTLLERRIAAQRYVDIDRLIGDIRRTLDAAAGITNRLLAFSRRQVLQPMRIHPNQFVGGMRDFLQRTIGPGIRLSLRLGGPEADIVCDSHQLEAALLNLVINARDAMPQGGELTVSVLDRSFGPKDLSASDQAERGPYVEIRVADTGIGMSPDVLARVFEPFFATKPSGQGTGLGLSQVYGFVRQSGGFSRIESAPGAGTSVSMYFPAYPRADGEIAFEAPERAEVEAAKTASGFILVVEDQDEVRAQIVEAFTDMGCEVAEAADGPSGLQIIESLRPVEVLVTDVGLPLLNGKQLADAARAVRPNCRSFSSPATPAARLSTSICPRVSRSCASRFRWKSSQAGSRLCSRERSSADPIR
jgi:CheY-like chemotaxis protein